MAQIFQPRANTIARIVLIGIVAVPLAAIALTEWILRSSYVTDVGRFVNQTVPFSHEHHAGGFGIDCRYCHTSVEKAAFAGIPPTHTCMTCHSQVWTNAEMLAPVRNSLVTGTPLHWRRVNQLPDYVYFDHSIHIAKGVGCTTCHGRVDRMPLMRKAESLYMHWCLACHREPWPHLRPEARLFSDWTPPADQKEQGKKLAQHYGVSTEHLTNCSICHR